MNLSPVEMTKGQLYDVWMALGPRQELSLNPRPDIGSMRLSIQFKQNFIYSSEVYEPLKALLYSSLKMKVNCINYMSRYLASILQDLASSPLFLIGQVCQNRNSLASVLVRIFVKDGEVGLVSS